MQLNYFPFTKYISYDLDLEKIIHVPSTIIKKEMDTIDHFFSMFHHFTKKEKRFMLQLDKDDILLFLTFYEVDSNYAVSIICHNNILAIVIELKSFNWLPFIPLLVNQFQREVKMSGTYFMSDETNMSEFRKQSRKRSLLMENI